MDFITDLPKSQGKDCIYVVVDKLTKYAHFIAIDSQFKASQVAQVFMKEIYRLHGMPKEIISNRDPKFLSNFWTELFKKMGTIYHIAPSTTDKWMVKLKQSTNSWRAT